MKINQPLAIGKSDKIRKQKKTDKLKNRINNILNTYFNLFSFILIILAGIIVYSNSFHCSFQFDDDIITDNPIIKDLSNFDNIHYWLSPARQLAFLSFALNYHFNKLEVFGYHLINLLIHIITGIFTFLLIRLILNLNNSKNIKFNKYKDWLALFSALLFVVHPIQTQAVTYIVQRMASMAAMFYILSIYIYALGRIEHTHKNNCQLSIVNCQLSIKAFIFYILAVILGGLSVLSKQNAATFPFAMLLFEFFFIRNKENKIFAKYIIISLTLIVILCMTYFISNPTIFTSSTTTGISISSIDYLMNQFTIIIRYLKLTIFPINQCLDYGNVNFNFPLFKTFWNIEIIASFLLLLGLLIFAVYIYKRNKILSFGIFWLFLTLSIESSIIPIADPMFEHRMYLPMLGWGLFLIGSIFMIINKLKPSYIFSIIFILISVLGISAYSRNKVWIDKVTLWSDVIKKAPYNARGWYNTGLNTADLKQNEESLKFYDEAIKLKPDYHEAWYNKGIALANLNKYNEANVCFDEAIKIKPDKFGAWNNKGNVFFSLEKYEDAIKCYNKVIDIKPDYFDGWDNKGNTLYRLEKYEDAIECYGKAIEIKPLNYNTWNYKGNSLFLLGRYEEAIKCYDKVLELIPDYQEAFNNKKIAESNLQTLR